MFQAEADHPEALATLPKLNLRDIQRTVETIPTERNFIHSVPAMTHDLFTNGIAYLDLAFDISDIPEALQPYLPLLGKLMTNMGAAGFSYEEMAKRVALKTGGAELQPGCWADSQRTDALAENGRPGQGPAPQYRGCRPYSFQYSHGR